MRITGGKAKGIPIKAPGGRRTRPTSNKVREAMFNVLGDRVSGARVLDLFAGSGAPAIDALSRGAEYAVMVEKDSAAVGAIRLNLERAGLAESARVVRSDFRAALARFCREGEMFDIVFVDPPYEGNLLDATAAALAKRRVITNDSVIIVEHFKKTAPPDSISGLPLHQTRNYGQTSLSYFLHSL